MALFSHQDVRDALALIDGAHTAKGLEPFAEIVVDALARIIPGDIVGYNEWEMVNHHRLADRESPVAAPSSGKSSAESMPCSQYRLSVLRRRSEARAHTASEYVSSPELHPLDYYDRQLFGIEFHIRLWLSAPPGIARYFYVSRRRTDGEFTERDRDLLEVLRPSLVTLRGRFDGHADAGGGHGLTHRETEILAWVARGKTNQEIAALLVLSPHTVRKHLERTYEKLRVHTRAAAVVRGLRAPSE